MKSVRLSELELGDAWYENDETVRWRDNLPLTPGTPGTSDVAAEDFVAVYFEVEPGKRVGTHTDSEEEILLVMEGTVGVSVGDDDGELEAGEMAVVPPKVPHSVRNVGDEPAAVLGVFPAGEVHHEFDEPVMPFEEREFVSRHETNSDN
ncbi:cupin domain-containing protein [Natronococcus pandeyae]|uniref:Cupin domain-containing protein n=1 Tax=Natronococcus pandeyae TaxID=2055836 RepID=A0A8J8Q0X7_9EURY|nr:cupin domain-containing protein [Natronococcus pandeyae]TYL37292.1 cupin domain-containing protein [Natronococcus pandeyae]